MRPNDYWIAISLLLWVGILALRLLGSLLPATDVWEGGNPSGAVVNALAVEPGQLLAGTSSGLYSSIDEGTSWQVVPDLAGCDVTAVAIGEGRVVAAGCDQLLTLTEGRWTSTPLEAESRVHQLLISGEDLLIASDEGLFTRTGGDRPESLRLWPQSGDPPVPVNAVQVSGESLLLGTDDGLMELDGASGRWREMGLAGKSVLGVDKGGDWVQVALAGPEGGLARLPADSAQWQMGDVPSEYAQVVLVDPLDTSLVYAGLWGLADEISISGVVVSTDEGATWEPLKSRLLNSFVPAMALDTEGRVLYAGTNGGGVFRYAMPSMLDRLVKESRPFVDTLEPLLLGVVALALLLRRRPARQRL